MEEQPKSKKPDVKVFVGIAVGVVIVALIVWGLTGRSADAPSTETTANTPAASSDSQSSTTDPDTPTDSTDAEPAAATITFTNNGFNPSQLTVQKGAVITVKNESSEPVQFSSDDHPTHTKETEMNLQTLQPGQSASFTITRVGTWGFHDHLDDSMTGTITVTE